MARKRKDPDVGVLEYYEQADLDRAEIVHKMAGLTLARRRVQAGMGLTERAAKTAPARRRLADVGITKETKADE